MTDTKPAAGSAKELANYVANLEAENENAINAALRALAAELEGNQRLIYDALRSYRDSLRLPSEDDFYDLIGIISDLTANFNANRIDISMIAEKSLQAWVNHQEAPSESVRRNVMLLLIDSAIEEGLLSGIGRVNDWLDLATGNHLPGNWLLVGKGRSRRLEVPEQYQFWYTPLTDLFWFADLPRGVKNYIERNELTTLGQLLMIGSDDVRKRGGVSHDNLNKLRQLLNEHGHEQGTVDLAEYRKYAP